jgi:hypothetical protein
LLRHTQNFKGLLQLRSFENVAQLHLMENALIQDHVEAMLHVNFEQGQTAALWML